MSLHKPFMFMDLCHPGFSHIEKEGQLGLQWKKEGEKRRAELDTRNILPFVITINSIYVYTGPALYSVKPHRPLFLGRM